MASGILAMLAKPRGGAKVPPAESPAEGTDEVASSLRDMFDALKAGDDAAAASAFRTAYEHSGGAEEETEGEDDLDL